MSKNRNQNQQQQRTVQQQPAQGTEQQQPNQEDQAQQDNAEQQSNDNAGEGQAEQQAVKQEPVQEKQEVATPVVTTKQEGFTPVMKVQLDLVAYAEAMDKKKSIVPEEGGRWQYSLFSTIKEMLNAKDQEQFNKEWNTALVFFNQNKDGIFNENFLFRFPAEWPGSQTEFTTFRRIAYVMIQTASPKTRKAALKDINLELVVEGLNQAQRTKLLNFYEA